ncbi:MAG: LPS assembly lipoprotein LptE [Candidatus Deferrimicrobiota bacterium]
MAAAGRTGVKPRAILVAGILLSLLLSLHACGYRLKSEPGSRFADPALRLDLRPFANASVVPDAGAFLAGRLREELRRVGFRGAFGRMGADYLIEGKIREIREDVSSHGSGGYALEHRLTLSVDIRVQEITKGRLIWKEERMSESASYFAGSDFQYTESNRRAAVEEVCRRMARRIGQTVRVLL